AYWPLRPGDPVLWNPRQEEMSVHLLLMVDGTLYPATTTGMFTLQTLRLNRPALVANRQRRQVRGDATQILIRFRELIASLELLSRHQAAMIEEQQRVIKEQRAVLKAILKMKK